MSEQAGREQLTIYTDGGCSPNPGPGGWGALIIGGGEVVAELSGFEPLSTNNRMELTAAVKVLESLPRPASIVLYTDSTYLKNGITQWIFTWQTNNWRTADRKEVKNGDLWRELLRQIERHQIDWRWVKGHGNDPYNIRADQLAVAARSAGAAAAAGEPARASAAPTEPVHLFTGVSWRHKGGCGGWSVILNWRAQVKILGGVAAGSSANQVYLEALVNGLKALKKAVPVLVHTNSGYLCEGATSWLEGWRRRGWRTREGEPVANEHLWKTLEKLLCRQPVSFRLEDRDQPRCFLQEAKELAREYADAS